MSAEVLEQRTMLSAGTLDPSFADGEIVATNFEGPHSLFDDSRRVVVSPPDGSLIVASSSATREFVRLPAVAKYNVDGSVDASFGSDGQVVLDEHMGFNLREMTVDAQGRILLVGDVQSDPQDFEVIRLTASGEIDTTFGENGRVSIDFAERIDISRAIEIQSDGKILVSGSSAESEYVATVAVARLNVDGTLDSSFGTDGRLLIDLASSSESSFGIALSETGRIMLGIEAGGNIGAVALLEDGDLDNSFGQFGIYVSEIFSGPSHWTRRIATDPDDSVLLAGTTRGANNDYDFFATRLSASGVVDASFGTDGITVVDIDGSTDQLDGMAIDSEGGVILSGHSTTYISGSHELRAGFARLTTSGQLDDSFGTGGTLLYGSRVSGPGLISVAFMPDGGIVFVNSRNTEIPWLSEVVVHRLNADGTTASDFGTQGSTVTNFTYQNSLSDSPARVFQLDDGRILVVGTSVSIASDAYPSLAWYHANGSLDTSTGDAGTRLVTELAGLHIADAAVQADGSIVVVGTSYYGSPQREFRVARLLADGSVDSTFGENGIVRLVFNQNSSSGHAIKLRGDGRIVVIGTTVGDDGYIEDMAVVQLLNDGSLDPTFGTSGVARVDFGGGHDAGYALAIQEDGRIVVGGRTGLGTDRYPALARLTAAGLLDTTFGDQGQLILPFVTTVISELAVMSDGRVVAAADERVIRFTPNGTYDETFGTGGVVSVPIVVWGMTMQSDGRVVLFGADDHRIAVVRLESNGSWDDSFGLGGQVTIDAPSATERADSVTIDSEGNLLVAATLAQGPYNSDFGLMRLFGGIAISADESVLVAQTGQPISNSGQITGVEGIEVTLSANIGEVTLNDDGSWQWSYNPTEPGQATIVTVTATTGGESRTATFTVKVNAPPSAHSDSFQASNAGALEGNLLANDTDPNNDALSVVALNGMPVVGSVVGFASGAQLLVNADGSFTYDPAGAFASLQVGQTAVETFNYTVSDGFGGTAVATVEILIHGATKVISSDVNPATTELANAQSDSDIGIGANGHVVVAWTHTTDSGDTDVRFRRYDATGTALDAADRLVSLQASGNEDSPTVAVAADGSFVIGYRVTDGGGNSDVTFDRYSASGNFVRRVQLFDSEANSQSNLDLAIATNGNLIAVWQEQRDGNDDVLVKVFNVQGETLLGPIALADEASGSAETNPAVAVDRAGNFVVAYSTASGVAAQRFSASGTVLGTRLLLSPPTLPPGDVLGAPQLGRSDDGSFVVAYAVTPASGSAYGYWHLLNTDGSLRAKGSTSPGIVINSVSMDAIGNFVLGTSRTTLGGDVQAEAIYFNSDGEQGKTAAVNREPFGAQGQTRVAVTHDLLAASYIDSSGSGDDVEYSLIRQHRSQVGVARPNAGGGLTFFLDSNGDGLFGAGDAVFNFGLAGDTIVVGDWNGDGIDDFGVARSNGTGGLRFYLDSNGNRDFDSGDRVFDFGLVGDTIVVGDWNGDGIADLGVARRNASGGLVFSLDGNGSWGFDNSDAVFNFGLAGDTIVVGDWNGDGIDDLGVARRNGSGGLSFSLDHNGSWGFDEADAVFNFGLERDRIVVGDWNGDGADGLGVVRPNGSGGQRIYRDVNENFGFDLTDSLFASNFGLADDLLLAGSWR